MAALAHSTALSCGSSVRSAVRCPSMHARPQVHRLSEVRHSAPAFLPSTSGRFGGADVSRTRRVQCQGLFGLGLPELAVIAGVAALVFGPSKLPEIGKSLGKTMKSFQSAAKEFETELKSAASEEADAATPPAASKEERVKRSE